MSVRDLAAVVVVAAVVPHPASRNNAAVGNASLAEAGAPIE